MEIGLRECRIGKCLFMRGKYKVGFGKTGRTGKGRAGQEICW